MLIIQKGATKFGLRFFIISIYPMSVGGEFAVMGFYVVLLIVGRTGTLMNALLFNVGLILMTCPSIIQVLCVT